MIVHVQKEILDGKKVQYLIENELSTINVCQASYETKVIFIFLLYLLKHELMHRLISDKRVMVSIDINFYTIIIYVVFQYLCSLIWKLFL